ncbi:MAG: hypothetical protein AB1480_03385 [Nitrospirota bacterium]
MKLDIVFHKGSNDRPAVIFIHGLGMDKDIWINPSKSLILGGRLPLKILLSQRPTVKDFGLSKKAPKNTPTFSTGEQPDTMGTLFHDLSQKGYTVVTWSQERPAGPIEVAVSELEEVVKIVHELTKGGIIIIGQSRGGLIGRRYLIRKDKSIRGLITISSPHRGSSMAKLTNYLSSLASLISPLFSGAEKGTLSSTIRHILNFLKSKALRELLPDSPFLKSLKDEPLDWVYYVSVGGTKPTLLTFYRLRWDPVREGELRRWFLRADELFSIPDILEKVIPKNHYPEEMKKGKGDGLVSAESSRIPWGHEHYNFELNHAEILFDKGVRDVLLKAIDNITHVQNYF